MRVGVDIVEVERVESALTSRGERFASRVFTEREIRYCDARRRARFQSYAARFAAKEAVSKLLGTGFSGFLPRDIEVITEDEGRPRVVLHGRARELAVSAGIEDIEISLSHVGQMAIAVAAAEGGRTE
jgi:holo-[acyl-carrier protein] synthase